MTAIVRADGASAAAASIHSVGSAIDSVGSKGQNFAGRMSTFGSSLTRNVSLPLVAIGGLAVKMAIDFDTSFARIQSLAGKTGYSMDQMKAKVIALGGETGQGPQQLADALYFVASAGLKASQVFPVLEASAKGAEIGMGNVADIAQTLTSLLNAYAGTGLDAGNAMNIMTAAVKDGKAEMSDFATGLGPVIAVAANAGISFNELAAGIAQATNVGVPFDRAVTGMRFLISSLTNPTAKATASLKEFGINAADLAGEIKTRGLIPVLQDLYAKFQKGGEAGRKAWADITGGARGSIVAVDLVGKHVGATNAIIRDTGAAAKEGATNFKDAFGAIVKNDPAIQFQKTFATLKGDLITLGNDILPFVTKALGYIDKLAKGFSHLSPAMQGNVVKFGALAIAAGPVLRILGGVGGALFKLGGLFTHAGSKKDAFARNLTGTLTPALSTAESAFGAFGGAAAAVVIPVGAAAAVALVAAHTANQMSQGVDEASATVRKFGADSTQGKEALTHLDATLAMTRRTFRGFSIDARGVGNELQRNIKELRTTNPLVDGLAAASGHATGEAARLVQVLRGAGVIMEGASPKARRLSSSVDGFAAAAGAATGEAYRLRAAINAIPSRKQTDYYFVQHGYIPGSPGHVATGGMVSLAGGGWSPQGQMTELTRPTMISPNVQAGEGGREFVLPANTRGASWIKDAVRQGVVEAGGFGSGQTPIVYVLIDGQDLRAKVSHGDALRGVRS